MELKLVNLFRNAEDFRAFAAGDTMFVVLEGNVDIRVGDWTIEVAGPG